MRLFEFLVVVSIVALTIAEARIFYRAMMEEAVDVVVNGYAGSFKRAIDSIRAMDSGTQYRFVKINSTYFFFNEFGWPANTSLKDSPSIYDQSVLECRQLWDGIFSDKEYSEFSALRYKRMLGLEVSLNKKRICRYSLMHKQEDLIFIDYDLITGSVSVVHPG